MEWITSETNMYYKTFIYNDGKYPERNESTCKKLRPGMHLSSARNFVVGPFFPCWMIAGNLQ
jgi:hypothetical protein